jgi:fumarylacetoacetase
MEPSFPGTQTMTDLNETHDPALTSWVQSANDDTLGFPVQNLPYCVFRRRGTQDAYRPGVGIGNRVLDLAAMAAARLFTGEAARALAACQGPDLNMLMALGAPSWSALRLALSRALREGSALQNALNPMLVPRAEVEFALPARIGDYTDFYISLHHATAVGRQFRPDNPLLPTYKWLPIGYHGRASSIGVRQHFHRPVGQTRPAQEGGVPGFGPSARLDYEFELGVFIGAGNAPGRRIALEDAESHVFGLTVLNDWSARDLQAWEYQPLGPFLAKNFATTISPWIVTLEALAPFRVPFERPAGEPQPLPYLSSGRNSAAGAFDVRLHASLSTEHSRSQDAHAAATLSRGNFRDAYWSIGQLVTHHTVNGCNLQPGDLLGTGTLSGPKPEQAGSLLELTQGGKTPLTLPWGEKRIFLEDGDEVILSAECVKPGYPRLAFGTAVGRVLPALP